MPTQYIPTGRFKVVYEDGSEQECKIRPVGVVAAERQWPGRQADGTDGYPSFEGLHFVVWVSMGRPGDDFDAWLTSVDEVIGLDGDVTDPSSPAAGDG